MRERLRLETETLEEINRYLLDADNPLVNGILRVIGKYGTPDQINAKAMEARKLPNLMDRLRKMRSPYVEELDWLLSERERGAFVRISEFRDRVLCGAPSKPEFAEDRAVTLEISALQYFPWLVEEAKRAIDKRELMPGRYIRVRKMQEQENDQGDLLAVAAAMQIIGASYVETLDTKGTDGSNVHLGGPETLTGYFGGIGQPNGHPLLWLDEYLYYYTTYGIQQVLNINPGTVLVGYIAHKLGIDMEFKISVFMGNDNPYSVLWTLLTARLFSRPDGSTPLVGFSVSNSIDVDSLIASAEVRQKLGLENAVRIEHHVTETYRSIVRQPYCRRDDLLEVADKVPNLSAKHEGGDEEDEKLRHHPSDILDYFKSKKEICESGEMDLLLANYLDKHAAVNRTAEALTRRGLSFVAARLLHRR
ncbi:MAG: hypothetical protein GX436_02960 [Synergistaceae bacterium]|nr:hypothetical protein [Synergistaceae bacterium]